MRHWAERASNHLFRVRFASAVKPMSGAADKETDVLLPVTYREPVSIAFPFRSVFLLASLALTGAIAIRVVDDRWMSTTELGAERTDGPPVIGVIVPDSVAQPACDALRIASEKALGESQGRRPPELLIRRAGTGRAAYAAVAERLVRDQGACVLVVACDSNERSAIESVASRHGVACVSVLPTVAPSSSLAIDLGGLPNQRFGPVIAWGLEALGRRAALVTGSRPEEHAGRLFARDLLKASASDLVADVLIAAGDETSLDAAAAEIARGKPSMVIVSADEELATAMAAALRRAGVTPDVAPCVHVGRMPSRHTQHAAALTGDYIAFDGFDLGDDTAPGALTVGVTVGIELAEQAIRRVGVADGRAIAAVMRDMSISTEHGPIRIDRLTGAAWRGVNVARVGSGVELVTVMTSGLRRPRRMSELLGLVELTAGAGGRT
jgi:hypothetical protein